MTEIAYPIIKSTVHCRHGILRGIEVGEVAEEDAEGVADGAVGVGDAGEDVVGEGDVVLIVLAGDPKAQDIGAMLVDERHEVDGLLVAFVGLR